MTGLLPIVEQLADAVDNAERADWLQRVPEGVVNREQVSIRAILQTRQFHAGVPYLDALLSKTNAVRLADGTYPPTVLMAVEYARLSMIAAVRAVEGA